MRAHPSDCHRLGIVNLRGNDSGGQLQGENIDLETARHRRQIGDMPPIANPHLPGRGGAIRPLSAMDGQWGSILPD
eukprot:4473124-Pyramimonas_sp.AAC.1